MIQVDAHGVVAGVTKKRKNCWGGGSSEPFVTHCLGLV
jgi:hypothetical protein